MKLSRPKLVAIASLTALLLALVLAPLLVATATRGWLWWAARAEGLIVEVSRVEAPLFRPVVLHGLRVRTPATVPLAIEIAVARAEVRLNLSAVFGRSTRRRLRDVSIEGARVSIAKRASAPDAHANLNWAPLENLFADTFRVSHLDFRIENGTTIVDGRDVSFAASEIETGALTIAEIAVASPLVSKRFTNLRGATSWQNQRLTLGAITLARAIDIDAITADFSHLALQRLGLEINVDVFGGKVRANLTTDDRAGRRFWDVAGTASDISLAQMAETLAWRESAAGAVRMCKFTFRGNSAALTASTASIWTEVSDLRWGSRAAETIMLGASIYNRRLHLEQLYVKQEKNQLTMSADAPLTLTAQDWPRRELNADVSATINDLNALAQLFGARAGEYVGELSVDGTVGVDERKPRGSVNATGAVQLTDTRIGGGSLVTGRVVCSGPTATIEQGTLRRGSDAVEVRGEVAFGDLREISARLVPTTPTVDVTAAPSGTCVSTLRLAPPPADLGTSDKISEIEVRGGLFASDWTVAVIKQTEDEVRTRRTFTLCPWNSAAGELRFVGTAPPP